MKSYYIALGVLILSTIFAVFSISIQAPDIEAIDVEVQEAVYLQNIFEDGKARIKVTVKNNSPKLLRIRESILTSNVVGYQLGQDAQKGKTIEPGAEQDFKFTIQEDWTRIPLYEPYWELSYDFKLEVIDIKGSTLEFKQIIPIPRQILPIQVVEPEPEPGVADEYLDNFYLNIRSGGPPKDGIPPIETPKFITVDQAMMEDYEIVILHETEDQVKVYPRYILVWHEIVNDDLNGENISITYCPLTGSAIGYYGENTDYGTSGKLVNSNLIMYDRATDSYWPQILGMSIRGERKAESLDRFNLVWTTWGLAKSLYPEALVLSEETGNPRSYGSDPYGSYQNPRGYYTSGKAFMGIMNEDDRLEPKEIVVGVKNGEDKLAIPKYIVAEKGVLNSEIGDTSIVAIYDPRLDTVRVFKRAETQMFSIQNRTITDRDMREWDVYGKSEESQLEQLKHFDVMWFGWSAFHPETNLVDGLSIRFR